MLLFISNIRYGLGRRTGLHASVYLGLWLATSHPLYLQL